MKKKKSKTKIKAVIISKKEPPKWFQKEWDKAAKFLNKLLDKWT